MHKHISSVIAITILLLQTGAVLAFAYMKSPDLRAQTMSIIRTITFQAEGDAVGRAAQASEPGYATVTDDNGLASRIQIMEPEAASTDGIPANKDIELPSEPEGFKPSPESEWAKGYLQMIETTIDALDIEIEYARQWQQTGGLYRDLTSGSRGADVRLVQYLLTRLSPHTGIAFDSNSVSGTYGPKTEAAIAALQKKLNIKPDGEFTDETRFFFDSLYFKDLCPDANVTQDKSYENVSRRIAVPKDYIPGDLIRLPRTIRTAGVMCLSREPARRLEEMFKAAAREGHSLAVISAYRSAHTQALLTAFYLRTAGKAGLAGIAEAGHSEHQLGTTVDLSGKSVGYSGPTDRFGTAPEGIWLAEHSYKFGFILSYPKGKDTGYIYEPWHFRYVGVDVAKDIFEEKMTIQEYLDLVKGPDADR